jgi:ATP-dependent DNA helicase PIF1
MLFIDEVSMISAELFDKISEYLSIIRNTKTLPFGGIQVILSGDMCQLPPVNGEYPFKAKSWGELNLECIEFVHQVRQNGDELFQRILNEARFGCCSDESIKILKALKNPNFGEIEPTILFSKNVNVDRINETRYSDLIRKGAERTTFETFFSRDKNTKNWAEALKIPESVDLCIGAQVMLTVNLSVEEGFANGSRGIVTDFSEEGVVVLFKSGDQILIERWRFQDDNDEEIWACAIPLKLAYALTIHKSQSMTLDAAVIDLGPSIFECGQAYVALSRVRDMKSVKILNILKSSFKTDDEVVQFYNEIKFKK